LATPAQTNGRKLKDGNGNSEIEESFAAIQELRADQLRDQEQFARLEAQDLELEERTESNEMRQMLSLVLSMVAMAFAVASIAAFIIAVTKDDGGGSNSSAEGTVAQAPAGAETEPATAGSSSSSAGSAAAVSSERYQRPDPTLPAVPPGDVKRFRVDVFEHVTKVAKDKPPARVWSYGVNGKLYRGTGVSAPIVVDQGDRVEMTLHNGASEKMDVKLPHSIDFHSSEVAPNEAFKTIAPGESHRFSFVAKHPGVFMYHCATDPVLTHTGNGMVGMMVVKPAGLPPAKELWINQQEFYLGKPGENGDESKMARKEPDVIAFNGFAAQYKEKPIAVERGERIRMYVLNSGPSIWSAFHVIGTVFDRTVIEGTVGRDAQTVNLAPSQGGWVEFTLDREGRYPFVTHAFGDMVKGGVGVLATENAPAPKAQSHASH
jgi:nitrite reductase (NO-forming)